MDEGFDRNLSHRCPWKQSASASFGLSCQTVRKLGLHEVSGVWRRNLSVRHERSHSPSLAFIQPVARDAPEWVFISTHISELASLLCLVRVVVSDKRTVPGANRLRGTPAHLSRMEAIALDSQRTSPTEQLAGSAGKRLSRSLGFHHPGYTRIASPTGGQTKR